MISRVKKNRLLKDKQKKFFLSEPEPSFLEKLGKAFTDENSAFNFPIKYPALDLDRSTKRTIILTASIISAGMIISAFIRTKK